MRSSNVFWVQQKDLIVQRQMQNPEIFALQTFNPNQYTFVFLYLFHPKKYFMLLLFFRPKGEIFWGYFSPEGRKKIESDL